MPGRSSLAEQVLLTTLVVKLAVMAALATMLVRYRRFRHILIFERRDWPDRLIFVAGSRRPARGRRRRAAAAQLQRGRPDASKARSSPGLVAGPYAGATVGALVGLPPLVNGEFIALPFAVGCGFAGGGLRELCPKEAIWHFSPFVFTSLPRRAWQMMRTLQVDWQVVLLLAPIGLELLRQALGARWSEHHRLFYLLAERLGRGCCAVVLLATVLCGGDADQDLEQRAHRAPAAGTGKAAAGRQDRGARQPDQPALPVQHARRRSPR